MSLIRVIFIKVRLFLIFILIRDVLKRNGTAVDAAIASLICNGVYSSQSMGIGGGFLMTIYSKKSGKIETLNARETAPGNAAKDMYHGDANASEKGTTTFSRIG